MIFGILSNDKTQRRPHLAIRGLVVALLFALGTFVPTPVSPVVGADDTLREAFASVLGRWDSIRGYRCTYVVTCCEADKGQEGFTARYVFSKPSSVRMEIFRGKDEGSTLLWEGGDTVRVKKAGLLSLFPVTLRLRNSLLLDSFGQDLHHTTWKYLLDEGRQGLQEGRLLLVGQEILGERRVQVFSNQYRGAREPFSRDLVYIDLERRWPVKVARLDKADRIIQESTFQDIEIDPATTPSSFREF